MPEQIGPYKIIQELGEGGFGIVYLAEQEQPVRRRVALKIIKLGMDTKQVIARFEAERQALAMMDHPNIARVFDAGATETGRPYFVMELVKGVPVTDYCDENRLTPRQRLELFIPICQAVQHAHQKGVIHRDIKPTNVLVTIHDNKPVPKVIDFGIAKAISQRLTEKTIFTEFRQMIGTPEYMSPEQAEISGLDIDTRTDVYSLGVLLYELLTGLTPFDGRDLRSRAYAEMQRVIREVEPPTPSTRVSTHENLPSIAAQRNVEPKKLTSTVRGELDWIVMKCLEKDRTRRYESPSALATDVMHYLADEPVVASPPSKMYRLRKFVRRNKLALGMAAAIFLALAGGLAAATVGFIRARRAEALAQQRLEQVTRESDKNAAVNGFLKGILTAADPYRAEKTDPTLREVMEEAAKKIEAGALVNQPEIAAEVRNTLGRVFVGLARPEPALDQLRASLDLRRKVRGNVDDPDVATTLNLIGMAHADLGQFESAEASLNEALAMRTRLFGASSAEAGETLGNLGSVLAEQGKLQAAEDAYRRAVAVVRAGKVKPEDAGVCLNGLAVTLRRLGKPDEAEKLYREAIELDSKVYPADNPSRGPALSNLAALLLQQGRAGDAEAPQREALRIAQLSLPQNHPDLALALNNMASILQAQGKLDQAEELYRQAVEVLRSAGAGGSRALGTVLIRLGTVLKQRNRPADAEPYFREAVTVNRSVYGSDHVETAAAEAMLASVMAVPDRSDEATPLYQHALGVLRMSPGPDPMLRLTLLNYSEIPMRSGRLEEAESIAREALDLFQRQPASPFELSTAQGRLATVLARRNHKLDEADKLARDALAARVKVLPPDSWIIAASRSLLGEVLLRQGKVDEAKPLIRESCEIIEKAPQAPTVTKADARERLALLERSTTTRPSTAPGTTPP
jgi:tetratricopeptide (TPR) repeat protein